MDEYLRREKQECEHVSTFLNTLKFLELYMIDSIVGPSVS